MRSYIPRDVLILCVVLERRLLEIVCSISGSVLLLAQFRFSRGLAVDTSMLLCWLFGVIRSPLTLRLVLQLGDFFLGLGDVLSVELAIWSHYIRCKLAYLFRLAGLVLLPFGDLGCQLLDNRRHVSLVHGRVNFDLGEFLDETNVHVELLSRRSRSSVAVAALLALLALLSTGAAEVVVLAILLLHDLDALDVGVVHSTANLGAVVRRLALLVVQSQGSKVVGGVEMADKTLGTKDLVVVGRVRGFLQLLVRNLSLLLVLNGIALGLGLFATHLPGLILVLLVCATALVVLVLGLFDGGPLLPLLALELGTLRLQRVEVLKHAVLLSLDGVQFLLDLGISVAESLGLRRVKRLPEACNLGLQVVDHVLGLIQPGKVLALLAHRRNVRQGLLLIDQAHTTRVDLLLQTGDLLVDLLNVLERHTAAGVVLLGNPSLQSRVQSIDLLLGA